MVHRNKEKPPAGGYFFNGEIDMEEIKRLDILLKDENYFESREKARKAIINGNVKICGELCKNPAQKFVLNENFRVEILGEPNKYVSRGAYKLEKAIKVFNVQVLNKIAIDIGSSTGGFSDVLLQNGVKKIYCIDVGKEQLHPKIRNSDKTVVYEQTDFRNIDGNLINDGELIVIDVSFISIEPIICKIKEIFKENEIFIVSLIKPQFECGVELARKYKGVIKNKDIHQKVVTKVINLWKQNGFKIINLTNSPIKGGDGNVEYLLYTCLNNDFINKEIDISKVIEDAFK